SARRGPAAARGMHHAAGNPGCLPAPLGAGAPRWPCRLAGRRTARRWRPGIDRHRSRRAPGAGCRYAGCSLTPPFCRSNPMSSTFPAVAREEVEGQAVSALKQLSLSDLPDNGTLVEIQYSGLNYKDGLALSGNRNKVARALPMVGGIDLVGKVVECSTGQWQPGDAVVLNGFGLSELHWGGFSRFQRVKGEWLVPLPAAFSPLQAMACGTAGYTAAVHVDALEQRGHM